MLAGEIQEFILLLLVVVFSPSDLELKGRLRSVGSCRCGRERGPWGWGISTVTSILGPLLTGSVHIHTSLIPEFIHFLDLNPELTKQASVARQMS